MTWLLNVLIASSLVAGEQPSVVRAAPRLFPKLEVQLPVSWEMSLSGFSQSRVASISESYAETWTYYQQSHGACYLESPRARVAVYGIQRHDELSRMPEAIVLTEEQLAQLLGINMQENPDSSSRLILLHLQYRSELENRLFLQPSRVETISISISFHN